MAALEKLSRLLASLWRARNLISLSFNDLQPDWEKEAAELPDSVVILLAAASASPSMEYADKAVALCLERETEHRDEAAFWNLLAARALHLRGMAHVRQAQTGLAETDFDAAIQRMLKSGQIDPLQASLYLARADLRQKRGNSAGMCEDLRMACTFGQCAGLASARRYGKCQDRP